MFFHLVYCPVGFENIELIRLVSHAGEYGVHLFFLISGCVVPLSLMRGDYPFKDFGLFFKKRLLRIEPTAMFCLVLALLSVVLRSWLLEPSVSHMVKLDELIINLLYLVPFVGEASWINPVY